MGRERTDFDTVLAICSHEYRRIVLSVLWKRKQWFTRSDLANAIATYDQARSVSAVPEEHIADIEVDLHHRHLPQLKHIGVIEYERERGMVYRTNRFDQLEPHLEAMIEADPALEDPLEF